LDELVGDTKGFGYAVQASFLNSPACWADGLILIGLICLLETLLLVASLRALDFG